MDWNSSGAKILASKAKNSGAIMHFSSAAARAKNGFRSYNYVCPSNPGAKTHYSFQRLRVALVPTLIVGENVLAFWKCIRSRNLKILRIRWTMVLRIRVLRIRYRRHAWLTYDVTGDWLMTSLESRHQAHFTVCPSITHIRHQES